MKDIIVGIDLGTTNSAVAAVVDGEPRVLEVHGQLTMPSCVGIDSNGKWVVGQAAKNQLVAAPESTVSSIKRRMGEEIQIELGDKKYTPEEISACILNELKLAAEKALGQPVTKAVITVPAFFNENQRQATYKAGELAGLEVVRIINEPTAAALAYRGDQENDETLLVYDLGGGTFDVSLVVVEQGVVEVKASHGDTHLGGDDFDELLVNYALLDFQKQHNLNLHHDTRLERRLKTALERAKCKLSDEPFAPVKEEYVTEDKHLELEIDRIEYEKLIEPLLDKTLVCVNQCLKDGGLTPGKIDKVMLVGGSTRTPLVHTVLNATLGLEPRWEVNPDLIVALGAAVQGAIISGQRPHSMLIDITPHTWSNSALGYHGGYEKVVCCPVIHRNTPLPASKSEQYFTHYDSQESVELQIYQGEGRLPEDNKYIGELVIEGLARKPAGNILIIHFKLDLNGMLHVTATEKVTGLSKSVVFDTRKNQGAEEMTSAHRNIKTLLESAEDIASTEEDNQSPPVAAPSNEENAANLLSRAKDLRKRAETLLKANINEDDSVEVKDLLHLTSQAIKERNWDQVHERNNSLSDLLFYLEE